MRSLSVVTALLLGSLLTAEPLIGQVCGGSPTLQGDRSVNVGLGADFFDGGKSFSGGVTVGSQWLVAANFGFTDFDETTVSQKSLSGGFGWEYQGESGLAVCPQAQVRYGFGMELGGADLTSWILGPGISLGFETDLSDAISVIPTGSAFVVYEDLTADLGVGGEFSESETYGVLSLGLGFVVNDRFSFGPSVGMPVGRDGGDTSFGLSTTVGMGN